MIFGVPDSGLSIQQSDAGCDGSAVVQIPHVGLRSVLLNSGVRQHCKTTLNARYQRIYDDWQCDDNGTVILYILALEWYRCHMKLA